MKKAAWRSEVAEERALPAMGKAGDAVTGLELGDIVAELLDDARVVAANFGADGVTVVDLLKVGRVEGNRLDLDQDEVVADCWYRRLSEGSFPAGGSKDGLHGGRMDELGRVCLREGVHAGRRQLVKKRWESNRSFK